MLNLLYQMVKKIFWRHDNQQNGIRYNDTQLNRLNWDTQQKQQLLF
jgi:hypothetical protein